MGIMLILCLIWGLQQVVLKAAASDISPLLQIALRSGVAALLVGLLIAWRGERMTWQDGTWRPGLLVGILFALEFLLVGEGLRFTSASHMVVLLYTAPIFVAISLHWKLPAERLALPQWLGVALAFGGIVVTFAGKEEASSSYSDVLWGDLLALLAGVAWAATTVAVRLSSLARAPAAQTLLYQLVAAFMLLTPAAVVLGQAEIAPTPLAWGSLLFQSIVVSFASYLTWFWLLRHYLASRLGIFSFMTPLFGVVMGVGLLDERMENDFLIGSIMVCSGIILVSGHGWFRAYLDIFFRKT